MYKLYDWLSHKKKKMQEKKIKKKIRLIKLQVAAF